MDDSAVFLLFDDDPLLGRGIRIEREAVIDLLHRNLDGSNYHAVRQPQGG
jgi:hypothetical protein